MKHKYFFGYLFVRIARILACLAFLAGLGYVLFKYFQAELEAETVRYRPSAELSIKIDKLRSEYVKAYPIVVQFHPPPKDSLISSFQNNFVTAPETERQFAQLNVQLTEFGSIRQQLKALIVERFEGLIEQIQSKLRAHAAKLAASTSTPTPTPPPSTPVPNPTPVALRTMEPDTLFLPDLGNTEIDNRVSTLKASQEFLKQLQDASENAENKRILNDSIYELESLTKLLPPKIDVGEPSPPPKENQAALEPSEPKKKYNAEKVAEQLGAVCYSVRQAILTSWRLDELLNSVMSQSSTESNKCTVAHYALKGLWLTTMGEMALVFIASICAAFLILVLADLTQTFLDTASNTGKMANGGENDNPTIP